MQHWLYTPSGESLPVGETYPTGEFVALETRSKPLGGRGLGRARKHLPVWTSCSVLLAFFLGYVLLVSVCTLYKTKRSKSGPVGRRLAGDSDNDEDFPMPASPELANLCFTAQQWAPAESSPGQLRASPVLVAAVLQQIEQSPETPSTAPLAEKKDPQQGSPGAGHGRQGGSTGPPGGSGDDSDGEEPGPSWQPTRTPQRPPHPSPSATLPSGAHAPHPLQAEAGRAPAESTPVGGEEPSISTSAPAASAGQAVPLTPVHHPYVRVPPLQEGVTPRAWRPQIVLSQMQWASGSQPAMLEIRRLLLLPSLSSTDLERLMDAGEELANYLYRRMTVVPLLKAPAKAVKERGVKFLMFSALHSIAQVVGRGTPPWWPAVAEAALEGCENVPEEPPVSRSRRVYALARDLSAALALYKSGSAPPPENIIRLKRALFFNVEGPEYFRRRQWDPWREDDRQASH